MKLIRVGKDEAIVSAGWRWVRAAWRWTRKPKWANHFCPGASGSGEWSYLLPIGKCGYCGERLRKND